LNERTLSQVRATTSQAVGSSWAFILSFLIIIVWAITGPMFHSRTPGNWLSTPHNHRYVLNGVLIQNTQNRDAKAIHLKLDELLKGVKVRARPGELGATVLTPS